MVGSETKYPAWTHQVHFDYFYNLPPICPPKYPLGTCWVFSKSTHHVIKMYPLGIFQRTHKELTMRLNFTTNPQRTHQIPTGYMLSIFKKYPPQNLPRVVLITHWVHLDYFCISPTLRSPKYPLGTCWVFLQSTHPDTRRSSRWVHSESTHQEPSG